MEEVYEYLRITLLILSHILQPELLEKFGVYDVCNREAYFEKAHSLE